MFSYGKIDINTSDEFEHNVLIKPRKSKSIFYSLNYKWINPKFRLGKFPEYAQFNPDN